MIEEDNPCKVHEDPECGICPYYEMVVEIFDSKPRTMTFWVGQDAGMVWGPIGMDDTVRLKYHEGNK